VAAAVAAKAPGSGGSGRILKLPKMPSVQKLRLWQDKIEAEITIDGSGPPLVFLHGPWGLRNDHAFLALLARTHTVYAPKHPGTAEGDPESVHQLDDWLDLIVYHGELFDRLGLDAPVVVGHSFGGTVACELAATMPERVGRLVLIDPVGLWRDDLPVRNWMIMPEDALRTALFAEPSGKPSQEFFGMPGDQQARVDARISFIWSQACTGKFVWPIPDKGLKKHIHRIAAPTLIIWGRKDGVIAPDYAQEFARRIANSRVALIEAAGHLPHLEQPDRVAGIVREFLVKGQ
jgi:pimeloyl-ACP methyl ester carboxylesterase